MTVDFFTTRRRLAQALGLTEVGAASCRPQAQPAFPARQLRIIVPFPPGGASDAMVRILATRLQTTWGQPVVVENRPGAGTVIGSNTVAKAPADGYTMGLVTSSHAINAAAQRDLPYDTLKDFAAVSQVALVHQAIFVRADSPLLSVQQLVEASKTRRITFATAGVGTAGHLFGELLNAMTDAGLVHVPYKGSSPAQVDLLAGHVDVLIDAMAAQYPMVKAGRMKLIALVSPQRHPDYPALPTAAETYPGASVVSFFGVVVPAATPLAVVRQLNEGLVAAVHEPGVRRQVSELGLQPLGTSPEAFDSLVRSEMQKWRALIESRNLQID